MSTRIEYLIKYNNGLDQRSLHKTLEQAISSRDELKAMYPNLTYAIEKWTTVTTITIEPVEDRPPTDSASSASNSTREASVPI